MKKRLSMMLLALGLAACQDSSKIEKTNEIENKKAQSDSQNDVVFKQDYAVPQEMQETPIYEMGELIKNLMLDEKQTQYSWDQLANDEHIQWQTVGYTEQFNTHTNSTITRREGLVRVHVLGDRVAILRERKYEAPWEINYYGAEAKWGVTSIDLNPTGDFQEFPDPIPSLKKQKISVNKMCEQKYLGDQTTVYLLKANNKQDIYFVDQISTGSAGSSRWLSLSMQDKSTEWCPESNAPSDLEATPSI
ncbi:hypothetical protein [Acinetobacter shaoyimingii]|uniref:Lipoprotein n=1 Tax=Acinetobacter shaoyimingii TaxID=2715164 RepID=A0A6G8RYE2_9GAMM|nr:hypothetical protein [Acinetobacter shaoyimingii]QIO06885.1 hypothetical protein G8E00_13510 [Acinetobacter shaoyimingii]